MSKSVCVVVEGPSTKHCDKVQSFYRVLIVLFKYLRGRLLILVLVFNSENETLLCSAAIAEG